MKKQFITNFKSILEIKDKYLYIAKHILGKGYIFITLKDKKIGRVHASLCRHLK